jgi:hypothetical protein
MLNKVLCLKTSKNSFKPCYVLEPRYELRKFKKLKHFLKSNIDIVKFLFQEVKRVLLITDCKS